MSEPVQSDKAPTESSTSSRKGFWDPRFVLTIGILSFLALIAAYLQYLYYPSVLLSNQFGETNVSVHLSFLTFQVNATRGVEVVPGIPSLDFFQFFVIVIILVSLSHYFERRRKKVTQTSH
ncbi:MAG: hypothetical protein ACRECH_04135 [Nitrososphaerales archaeon]